MPLDALRKAEAEVQEYSRIVAEFEADALSRARRIFDFIKVLVCGLCFLAVMVGIPVAMMIAGGGR